MCDCVFCAILQIVRNNICYLIRTGSLVLRVTNIDIQRKKKEKQRERIYLLSKMDRIYLHNYTHTHTHNTLTRCDIFICC